MKENTALKLQLRGSCELRSILLNRLSETSGRVSPLALALLLVDISVPTVYIVFLFSLPSFTKTRSLIFMNAILKVKAKEL